MFRLDLLLAAAVFSIGSVIFLCIALFVVTLAKLFLTFVIAIGPAVHPVPGLAADRALLRQLAVDGAERGGADLVRVLRAGSERLHGRRDVQGHPGRRRLPRRHVQRPRRGHALLRADDPHGHHLLPGPQPRLCTDRRCRSPARHPDDPERHDGLGPALRLRCAGRRCRGAAGGVVRAGAGLPYAAGQATGAAAAATGRAAGTMAAGAGAVVRQGYGAVRTAAYKLAALRGRA